MEYLSKLSVKKNTPAWINANFKIELKTIPLSIAWYKHCYIFLHLLTKKATEILLLPALPRITLYQLTCLLQHLRFALPL